MSFEEFGLSPELLSGLADVRIEEPTPLQNEVIPPALQGRHLLVKHEAGDDGVFLIPALQKLTNNGEVSGTQILILTPSVERAKAIDETVWAMGYHAQISSASLNMKGNRDEQEQALKDGAPVVVANPGRLIELLEKNKFKLSHVELVIIDEAHNMENYNLVSRVKDIMQFVETDPQVLIFSESNNKAAQQLSSALLKDPQIIGFEESETPVSENEQEQPSQAQDADTTDEEYELDQEEVNRKLEAVSVSVVLNPEEKKEEDREEKTKAEDEEPAPVPENLTQAYIYVPPRAKISTLLAHLEKTLSDKIVVFAASKRTTDRLFRIIRKKGWGVVSINPGLDPNYYEERFSKFTSGEMKILLVGGLSATEIELEEVKQVINYDVPNEVEEYKYRAELIGRGKAARMVSLVSKMDKDDIDEIVKKVGYAPTEIPLPKEVKEKKKERPKKTDKKPQAKKQDKDDRKRRKKTESKQSNGLPRPTYDGLSGGKHGQKDKKRPAPNSSDGAFGWIKKLFD